MIPSNVLNSPFMRVSSMSSGIIPKNSSNHFLSTCPCSIAHIVLAWKIFQSLGRYLAPGILPASGSCPFSSISSSSSDKSGSTGVYSTSLAPGKLYSRQPRNTSSNSPQGNCSIKPNPPIDAACILWRPCIHDLNSRHQLFPSGHGFNGTRNGQLLLTLFHWMRFVSTTHFGKCPCWSNFSSHILPIWSYVPAITQNGVSLRGGGVSHTNRQTLAISELVVPLPFPPVRNATPSPLYS